MVVRFYSSVAPETTLSAGITNATTSIQLGSVTGFPTNTPFTLALDYEGATEELVQVTSVAVTTCTVVRGIDGTSAASHNAGARVRHVTSARDFADSRTHENSSNGVHGLAPGEDLVGTDKVQTLSNKTFINATGSLSNVTVNNVGNNALKVVGDPTSPSAAAITAQPSALLPITFNVLNNGTVSVINVPADDGSNNAYKYRLIKSGGADIFSVFSGGSVNSNLNNGADGFGLTASTDDVTRQGFYINSKLGANRMALFTNGTMDLNCSSPGNAILDVKMASGQTGSPIRVLDSLSNTVASVTPSGSFFGTNVTATGQVAADSLFVTTSASLPLTSAAGTSVFTVASGWSLTSAQGAKIGGTTTIVVGFQRTGATLTAGADGNIPGDPQIGTISAAYRPNAVITQAMMGLVADGGGAGSVRINTDGTMDLLSWAPGGSIPSGGASVYRFQFSFPSA